MDFAQLPIIQGGAVAVLLAVAWLVFRGLLVPRSVVEDVRKDRDDRLADAERETEQWRQLYEGERAAHEVTRQAHAEETRAALAAGAEGSQMAAALLTELKARAIGAKR